MAKDHCPDDDIVQEQKAPLPGAVPGGQAALWSDANGICRLLAVQVNQVHTADL